MNEEIRQFRQALSQFATGVTIVSSKAHDGKPIGITVNSFNSVSLDPPLVLFSVARTAHSIATLSTASCYAVNVLSEGQEQLSNRFAKPLSNKWQSVNYLPGEAGAPIIAGAIAHFECAPYAQYDGGDHVIFVGRVVRFRQYPAVEPLVFFRGRYRSLRSEQAPQEWPLHLHY
jgi:flavin reductase (DIM6/NTAB) family NADH-FMN oxidoreductase RutF